MLNRTWTRFEGLADMSMPWARRAPPRMGAAGSGSRFGAATSTQGTSGRSGTGAGWCWLATQTRAGSEVHEVRLKLGPNKAKLFAKSGGRRCASSTSTCRTRTISGEPGSRLKIKDAEATLAKPAAEVLSEAFDFPFRKGIPIGTMTVKATLTS